MPGIVQVMLITRQHFGTIPTYCIKCDKKVSFKMVREDSSYTQLCGCGCSLFQYHKPDEFHSTAFFTRKFIPSSKYDPTHKEKDELQKIGFSKEQKENGKTVYKK
jgi:predicted  nucleic acid-binding Zn-ribbon protein